MYMENIWIKLTNIRQHVFIISLTKHARKKSNLHIENKSSITTCTIFDRANASGYLYLRQNPWHSLMVSLRSKPVGIFDIYKTHNKSRKYFQGWRTMVKQHWYADRTSYLPNTATVTSHKTIVYRFCLHVAENESKSNVSRNIEL